MDASILRVDDGEFGAGLLRFLDKIGGAAEEDAEAVADEGEADGGGEVAFADAGGSEDEDVGAVEEPAGGGGDGIDAGHGEVGDGIEVEGVESFAGEEAGLCDMAVDAAGGAFVEFMLDEGGEEARGGPAFLAGLFGEARPEGPDGGEAEFAEGEGEGGGIDAVVIVHAGTPFAARDLSSSPLQDDRLSNCTSTPGRGESCGEKSDRRASRSGSCRRRRASSSSRASRASQHRSRASGRRSTIVWQAALSPARSSRNANMSLKAWRGSSCSRQAQPGRAMGFLRREWMR